MQQSRAIAVPDLVDQLIDRLGADADLVVPIANGEPIGLLDALEASADRLEGVRVHQMHALRDRPYLHGAYKGRLEHVSWFLSHVTRPAFQAGGCHFAPANFSEVPQFLLAKEPAAVLAAASPPDELGYFSLGVSADYAAAMIGRVPVLLEVNPAMPRTFGANRLHVSEVDGWCQADHVVPWHRDGPTDQANGGLLCGRHNRMKNDGWSTRRGPDGTWQTIRPDGTVVDPAVTPFRSCRWHDEAA